MARKTVKAECWVCTLASRYPEDFEFVVERDPAVPQHPIAFTRWHRKRTDSTERQLARHLIALFGPVGSGTVSYIRPADLPIPDHAAVWWSALPTRTIVPQQMADEIALIFQRYVGYFHGYHVRGTQMSTYVERTNEPWKEPVVIADDCMFCSRMTDEDVRVRISGFMKAMAKEIGAGLTIPFVYTSIINADPATIDWDEIEKGFTEAEGRSRLYRFDRMPLRLQRKIIIEVNHVWLKYLKTHPGIAVLLSRDRYPELEGKQDPPPSDPEMEAVLDAYIEAQQVLSREERRQIEEAGGLFC